MTDQSIDAIVKKGNNEKVALSPAANSAAVVAEYSEIVFGTVDNQVLLEELLYQISCDDDHSINKCKEMLLGQAFALQSIFVRLSRLAAMEKNIEKIQRLLNLGLKAQNQCRTTMEALAGMNRPPAIYAQQANIAQGHQQVNNKECFVSGKIKSGNNEVLEDKDEENRLVSGTQSQTVGCNPAMEAVVEVNRSKNN